MLKNDKLCYFTIFCVQVLLEVLDQMVLLEKEVNQVPVVNGVQLEALVHQEPVVNQVHLGREVHLVKLVVLEVQVEMGHLESLDPKVQQDP